MDWGQAKNVLIYAFLLLNLVLGYQLWNDMQEQASSSLDFTSLPQSTQQMMEAKGIQVLSPLPTETPQLPKIAYRYNAGGTEWVVLKKPVDSKLIFDKKALNQELEKQIPNFQLYQHDEQGDRDGVFVLRPLVDGEWPLFNPELQLDLYYRDQKIEAYRQPVIEIQPSEDVEEQKMLSASKALGNLVERNVIPENSVVKDIRLGYYGELFNSELQLAAPAWRFTLDKGQTIYVQGISGDVYSPKTDKTKE